MSKKIKRVLAVFCGLVILIGGCTLHFLHFAIINSKPDTCDWVLTNGEYTVCPVIEENVTFYVKNAEGETVYTAKQSWRAWDFDSINISENNDIIAISNDIGEVKYVFDNGTWKVEG